MGRSELPFVAGGPYDLGLRVYWTNQEENAGLKSEIIVWAGIGGTELSDFILERVRRTWRRTEDDPVQLPGQRQLQRNSGDSSPENQNDQIEWTSDARGGGVRPLGDLPRMNHYAYSSQNCERRATEQVKRVIGGVALGAVERLGRVIAVACNGRLICQLTRKLEGGSGPVPG